MRAGELSCLASPSHGMAQSGMVRRSIWSGPVSLVITIAQQKGGAGKTMLAANIAVGLAGRGRVALLDTDPQRSLTRWFELRSKQTGLAAIDFSEVSGWRLPGVLDRLRREHDILVVDSPPHLDADARRAVRAADLVLVPVQPSAPDLWAADGTLAVAVTEKVRAILVVNRAPTTAKLREMAVGMVAQRGHAILPAVLGNRGIFAHAFAQGMGVLELGPKTIAAREMRSLLDAITSMLG